MSSAERKISIKYQRFMSALKEFRLLTGMNQTQVAKALGKSQDWVSRCETGEHPVTFVEAMEFAELYSVSIIDFAQAVDGNEVRRVKDSCFIEKDGLEPINMTWGFVRDGMNYAYSMIDAIDLQLDLNNSGRLSTHVELANLSSITGNLIGAGLEKASNGVYERNRPHAYPDLLRKSENGYIDELGVEIKFALETNKPKGHLPKIGYYMTFRYVLGDSDGQYKRGERGDTVWIWEVRFGFLNEDDFSLSSTAGDSGKTAVIKTQAFYEMSLIYFDKTYNPHTRLPYSIPTS
jgi:transcriptional regulator with XRE-family HTH domain